MQVLVTKMLVHLLSSGTAPNVTCINLPIQVLQHNASNTLLVGSRPTREDVIQNGRVAILVLYNSTRNYSTVRTLMDDCFGVNG